MPFLGKNCPFLLLICPLYDRSLLQVMLETLGPDGSSTKLSDMAMKVGHIYIHTLYNSL